MAYNRTLQHFTSPQELATLWATGRDYLLNQVVIQDNKLYRCLVNHTSGTFQTDYANSNWVELSSGMVPWVTAVYYTANQFVEENDKIYRCLVSHTSTTFSADIGAGKWVEISAGSGSGTKNYITNGDFEQNTDTGWSLASSTLDATTKLPNQVSASWTAASGSLSKSVISSGQLAGSYSLQLSSTAATTAGNMLVTDALALDLEAQATIQTFSFFYKVAANGVVTNITTTSGLPTITVASASGIIPGMILNSTNGGGTVLTVVGTTITLSNNASVTGTVSGTFTNTLPGTSSNPLGVAIYDATNNQWIQPAGVYNLVQSSGVGQSSGTFQVPSNCTSVRLAVYFPNSAGATATYPFTVVFDDFQLGPQKVLAGAAISDWQSYTPTLAGVGTATNVNFKYRRSGDTIQVTGAFQTGTPTAVQFTVSLPYGTIDAAKINENATIGNLTRQTTANQAASVLARTGLSTSVVYVGGEYQNVGQLGLSPQNGSSLFGPSEYVTLEFFYPAAGLSSNTVMSQDTDTRVVAFNVVSSAGTGTIAASFASSTAFIPSTVISTNDSHASWNSSTGVYTVPVSGTYRIAGGLKVEGTHGAGAQTYYYWLGLYKGASQVASQQMTSNQAIASNPFQKEIPFEFELPFVAGDQISLRVASTIPSPIYSNVSSGQVLSISRISGPATIAASETVACRYKNSSGTNIPGSAEVFKYTIKDFDTHGFYSTSTGLATIPVSGKYSVTASLASSFQTLGVQQGLIIELYKNSVVHSRLGVVIGNGNGNLYFTTGSDNVQCVAGDTLAVYATWGAGVAVPSFSDENFNHISIHRVGN